MIEQKFLITSDKKETVMGEVNQILEEGWLIISMVPRTVSNTRAGTTHHGAFAILFEREK